MSARIYQQQNDNLDKLIVFHFGFRSRNLFQVLSIFDFLLSLFHDGEVQDIINVVN